MSSHAVGDNAQSSPLWALMQVNKEPSAVGETVVTGTTASTAQTALFENNTPDAYVTGATIGLFNYGDTDIGTFQSTRTGPAHAGWSFKTTGTGGRSGRTQYEVLVTLTSAA